MVQWSTNSQATDDVRPPPSLFLSLCTQCQKFLLSRSKKWSCYTASYSFRFLLPFGVHNFYRIFRNWIVLYSFLSSFYHKLKLSGEQHNNSGDPGAKNRRDSHTNDCQNKRKFHRKVLWVPYYRSILAFTNHELFICFSVMLRCLHRMRGMVR